NAMNLTDVMEERLFDLLEKTFDLEKLYEKAAVHANSPDLKEFFGQKAMERQGFGNDLKMDIMAYRPDSDNEGTASGKMQRGWMDVKAFFSANNDRAMLKEAVKGERKALDEYNEALELTNLPPSTEVLLTRQRSSIAATLSTLERMAE